MAKDVVQVARDAFALRDAGEPLHFAAGEPEIGVRAVLLRVADADRADDRGEDRSRQHGVRRDVDREEIDEHGDAVPGEDGPGSPRRQELREVGRGVDEVRARERVDGRARHAEGGDPARVPPQPRAARPVTAEIEDEEEEHGSEDDRPVGRRRPSDRRADDLERQIDEPHIRRPADLRVVGQQPQPSHRSGLRRGASRTLRAR